MGIEKILRTWIDHYLSPQRGRHKQKPLTRRQFFLGTVRSRRVLQAQPPRLSGGAGLQITSKVSNHAPKMAGNWTVVMVHALISYVWEDGRRGPSAGSGDCRLGSFYMLVFQW